MVNKDKSQLTIKLVLKIIVLCSSFFCAPLFATTTTSAHTKKTSHTTPHKKTTKKSTTIHVEKHATTHVAKHTDKHHTEKKDKTKQASHVSKIHKSKIAVAHADKHENKTEHEHKNKSHHVAKAEEKTEKHHPKHLASEESTKKIHHTQHIAALSKPTVTAAAATNDENNSDDNTTFDTDNNVTTTDNSATNNNDSIVTNLTVNSDNSSNDNSTNNNFKLVSTDDSGITHSLKDFKQLSPQVQSLISAAINLSKQNLAYHFGSDNPKTGGMDCSGTMYFLLKTLGMNDVPRQADQFYKWVWQKGHFFAVNSHHFNTFEFSQLKPGDLLFWTDTYQVDRDPPITHVMLYLGQDKNGMPLMFGASQGFSMDNQHIRGVNIFDFRVPTGHTASRARFIGYGTIPGLQYNNFDHNT